MKKNIGNAVKRNKIKRKLKAAVQKILREKRPLDLNYTYVIFGRNNVYKDKFSLIFHEVNDVFKKIKQMENWIMKLINHFLILLIKFYKYLISPYFVSNCRFLPTCSDYFIDCLKYNGTSKGLLLGIRRILKCHPIKILGAKSGFDPAPDLRKRKK